jgi:hypothetical protein
MSTQQNNKDKKVIVIGREEGGWTLTDKKTGKQIAFVGENLPLDSYLPADCEIERN